MARKDFSYQTKHYRKLIIGAVLPMALMILLVQVLSAQQPQGADAANIEVTKSVNQEVVQRGDTVQYLINMNNVGDQAASGAVMTDTVPSDLTVITASVTGGYDSWGINGNVVTWTGAIAGNGGVIDITIDAVVSDTAAYEPITNTVFVTGTGSLLSNEAVLTVTEQITSYIYMPIIFMPAPTPTLLSVSFPTSSDGYDTFQMTVNWSDEGDGGYYELQESRSSSFSNPTTYNAGTAKSKIVSYSISNDLEYYYRVRFVTNSGVISQWSNVIMQYVPFIDHFNDVNSGWKLRREDLDDTDNDSWYDSGNYVMKIRGRWDFSIGSSMVKVPWSSYRIEARMRFDDGVDNLHSYGLIWGGDWDGTTACPNEGFTSCLNHYYRLNILWYGAENRLRTQIKRIDYHDEDGSGRGESLAGYADNGVNNPSGGWQTWAVERDNSGEMRMFINNETIPKRTVTDSIYNGPNTYFGVLATSNEYSGTEPWVDWFKVTPLP